MTKPIDDGGPAYPHNEKHDDGAHWFTHQGLTKREAFVMAAMQGLCANSGGPFQANDATGWNIVNCKASDVAGVSIGLADALMAALKGE